MTRTPPDIPDDGPDLVTIPAERLDDLMASSGTVLVEGGIDPATVRRISDIGAGLAVVPIAIEADIGSGRIELPPLARPEVVAVVADGAGDLPPALHEWFRRTGRAIPSALSPGDPNLTTAVASAHARLLERERRDALAAHDRASALLAELRVEHQRLFTAFGGAVHQLEEALRGLARRPSGVAARPEAADAVVRVRPTDPEQLRADLFDAEWYLGRYPDVGSRRQKPFDHYLRHGWREGRDPFPEFSTSWYLRTYDDVSAARLEPLLHYLQHGAAERRDPHPLFSTAGYLDEHPESGEGDANPLVHYLDRGWRQGFDPTPLLDVDWYREQHPELGDDVEPLAHYATEGWRHGADPHPLFPLAWYLGRYPDVAATGEEPLGQFLHRGWRELRDPHPLFSTSWYLSEYPDVDAAGLVPIVHYLRYGWRSGRDPHPLFSASDYLRRYPDVAAAGIEPLTHYVTVGLRLGYRALSPRELGVGDLPDWA